MPRRVKDFIDISEYTSLDDLIRYLETIRDNLPPEHQAELENKYDAGDGSIEDLRRKLDEVPYQLGKTKGR